MTTIGQVLAILTVSTISVSRSDFEKGLGQTVTLDVYRARDGKLLGSLLKITFADGKSLTSDPMA
jgi:hypothetical protein